MSLVVKQLNNNIKNMVQIMLY